MAYFVISSFTLVLLVFSSIQTAEPATTMQSELVTEAISILSDSGYVSMSLTLELASQTLTLPSSAITIFAPSDTVFVYSGQPNSILLQFHISPLKSLPYGARIPTLFENQSLLVTNSFGNGGKISLNGVRINETALIDYGSLSIFAVDDFFDPAYLTSNGCKDRFYSDVYEFDNEIVNVSAVLLSRGYSIMSSSLDLQLRGLVKETTDLTIFAVADSVLAPYLANSSLGSVFHRHFLPCKVTVKDLWGLEDETTLQTLDRDFSIEVSKLGQLLLFNDVPIENLVPEMYLSDSIVVHGLNQILTSMSEPHQIGEAFSIGDDDHSSEYDEFWGIKD